MKKLDQKTLDKMTRLALRARDNAYAPYSDHPVGAAVLAGNGQIYVGANCEFANYDVTCSENAAIANMTSDGERVIKAILTVGPSKKYVCTPCGRCRQRIREFGNDKTLVYSMKDDGSFGALHTLQDLLPVSFGPENMAVLGHGPIAKYTPNKNKKTKKKKK